MSNVSDMIESNLIDQADALLRAIGRTVIRFQQVEQWLAEELALLLRMQKKEISISFRRP